MYVPVLILLAVVWAIVLVPPFVRNRAELRPGSSVKGFRHDLAVIGRTTPGGFGTAPAPGSQLRPPRLDRPSSAGPDAPIPGTPSGRAAARKRRRDVLFMLAGVAGFTLLMALAFGGGMWMIHLLADAALGGYVYLLVQMRRLAEEQAYKVRSIAAPAQSQPRLVVVRRTATG